jgi:hypothetical protein
VREKALTLLINKRLPGTNAAYFANALMTGKRLLPLMTRVVLKGLERWTAKPRKVGGTCS